MAQLACWMSVLVFFSSCSCAAGFSLISNGGLARCSSPFIQDFRSVDGLVVFVVSAVVWGCSRGGSVCGVVESMACCWKGGVDGKRSFFMGGNIGIGSGADAGAGVACGGGEGMACGWKGGVAGKRLFLMGGTIGIGSGADAGGGVFAGGG